jgi:hypothetical protein
LREDRYTDEPIIGSISVARQATCTSKCLIFVARQARCATECLISVRNVPQN